MKIKILIIFAIISLGKAYSQARYTPRSYSETMAGPIAMKQKYDENQRYLYDLEKRIIEIRSQIDEKAFLSALDSFYMNLKNLENSDLARKTNELNNISIKISKLISEYNDYIEYQNKHNSTNNKSNNDSYVDYIQKGLNSYKNKEFANAVSNFSKYLENDKNNTDIIFYRAMSKSESNDNYGAITDYEKIIELNSNYPMQYSKLSTVYNNKAYCLVKLLRFNEALPFVNIALELDKTEWYIWDTRGEIYYNLNNFDKCVSDMTKAISIEENGNSFFYRGLANIKLGKKVNGCKDLSKASELGYEKAYEKISKNCK